MEKGKISKLNTQKLDFWKNELKGASIQRPIRRRLK